MALQTGSETIKIYRDHRGVYLPSTNEENYYVHGMGL